jgi:uncharacterized YccA/Bax inhibitor family protein
MDGQKPSSSSMWTTPRAELRIAAGRGRPTTTSPEDRTLAVENPALNAGAFERGAAGERVRVGLSATGTYLKTALLLVILVVAAAFGWSQVEIAQVNGRIVALQPGWTGLVLLLTFILGIAGAFAFRAAVFIAPLYALCEGALLGVLSHYYNLEYDGIVLQATVATIAVFTATLLLYTFGIIKVTARFATGVIVAMGALVLVWTTAWLLSVFGVNFTYLHTPTPLGIALSLGVVVLGALNLPLDFDFVRRAEARGTPKFMEWYGAYGLMLSIIWIYVSILRLLALLRASS